jgi:universal stress protein A
MGSCLAKDTIMGDFKLQRILAPTDRSAFSQKAVAYAHDLAKHFGAELHVLRVMSDMDKAIREQAVMGVFDPALPPDKHSLWLEEFVGETGDVRRIETVQVDTHVPEAIVRYARNNDIDMIVIATHGRTGLTHLLMGSVAEKVVRSAPCPVLTLHPETLQ